LLCSSPFLCTAESEFWLFFKQGARSQVTQKVSKT
jgi:hypothetical protein